jgi:tetratricopeptide (TPR) repeat protein
VLVQTSKAIVVVAICSALTLGAAWGQAQPQAQASQQKGQKNWKDRAEYDLYEAVRKEADAKKALELLNTWKEKYPNSDYKDQRQLFYLSTYQRLGDAKRMMETAKEILAEDPNDFQALYAITLLTPAPGNTTPEALALGEKSARGFLARVPEFLGPDKRPASTPEAQWAEQRSGYESLGHRALGWIALQRKDYQQAETELEQVLKLNPRDAEASAWLGTAIIAGKQVDKQSDALFFIARAACYTGPGALDEGRRKSMDVYLNKAYATFHGKDPAGLQELCEKAKASAFPPADFKILSEAELAARKEELLTKENPQLAFWLKLKAALLEPTGEQYFESGMKDALVPPEGQPPLKGILISHEPAKNPKTLVLGLSNANTPEVTLKLETPLVGKADPGTALEFRGEAKSFTKEPFMVIFNAEKANISGWPAPPPPVKKAVPKKGVVKKKK